ncbi:MAG: hypothetical protein QM784_13485 [Polyangiaceae bacterium]
MSAKRHLPVLKNSDGSEIPVRSAGYVVFLGALSIFVSWLPLGVLGLWATQALVSEPSMSGRSGPIDPARGLVQILPLLLAFAAACTVGGALVGRLATTRHLRLAVLSGPLASFGLVLLVYAQGALRPQGFALAVLLALVPISAVFAWIGAILARKSRG